MLNSDPKSQNPSDSSEMGEAADGTGTTQPTTQQPVQDMNQVMLMMGQLIAAQHAARCDVEVDGRQRSEFKFTKYHRLVFTRPQR